MSKLYFVVMWFFSKKGLCSPIYRWAYMRCLKAYMNQDPDLGYFQFAEDYLGWSKVAKNRHV